MRSIAITSGKGGVGKTNIAVNLALALGAQGARVLLLDADLGLANADVLLGHNAERTLADALVKGQPLTDVLTRVTDQVMLLPASSGVLQLERLTPDRRAMLGRDLDELAGTFDYLLIDTGAGIGDNVIFFNDLADAVLLVTVPEPAALTDAYAMIKVLSQTCGHRRIALLVNQAASSGAAASVHERLSEVAKRFLSVAVEMVGYVPTDPVLLRAVAARKPVIQYDAAAPSSRALALLASRVEQVFLNGGDPTRRRLFEAWADRTLLQRSVG